VASGEVEIAVQQVSELMHVPGIEVVGRLPPEIGDAPVFAIGVFAASTRRADAERLVAFLCPAEAADIIETFGLEPLARG